MPPVRGITVPIAEQFNSSVPLLCHRPPNLLRLWKKQMCQFRPLRYRHLTVLLRSRQYRERTLFTPLPVNYHRWTTTTFGTN